ncbi:unnamed protein product [Adineta steineri]|uniref:Uncharacterized protein n=1 Tax=Adineta steineri TaxID=433720 RepID=A0A818Q2W7_9BILA|nr:unnamed protein product [Adineta steineri]CAF3628541.1 unnamed protein product [Adineta steineri]
MSTSDKTPKELIEYQNLGRTDLKVSLLSSGAWVISTKNLWGTSCYHPHAIKANLKGLSRKRIVEGIRGSLKRLDLEYDNLYKPPISYGTTIWSPLASGLLTEKYNSKQLDGGDNRLGLKGNLSLASAAKNPNVSTVITGASRSSQVAENFKALTIIPELISDIMEEIEQVLKNKPKHPYDWTLMK